ncbi:aldose 1-epimerase [Sphingomonas faeni]|uniref:aldose 1-epimerase n=1 Tax=Sphingomonas faeni TaxID=185950 RepID=UPI0033484096
MLHLEAGDWRLTLQPELGGTIAALAYQGRDILRPTPPGATSPLETASFPLVPYANRIADGRFTVDGIDYHIPLNMSDQVHPLHGLGWLSGWAVEASDPVSAVLVHVHEGDERWPWAYRAEQHFTLEANGLRVSLSVENRDSKPMPAGLGFHPYFPADGTTRLTFDAQSVWLSTADLLPTKQASADHFADWSTGAAVARDTLIDNAYDGWSGTATIETADDIVLLAGEGTPYFHVFMPPGLGFYCAEPVSDLTNAINRGAPTMLAQGETRTVALSLTIGSGESH